MINDQLMQGQKRARFLTLEYWVERAKTFGKHGHFSNFGEQEIIEKYIDILQIAEHSKTVVDIGAGDGIRKSNTYNLLKTGWKVIGIDCDRRRAARMASLYKLYPKGCACMYQVTPGNIVDLLQSFSIEKHFGILSLDIDSFDYWVLDAVLSAFRPRLIVSEYNEKIPPPVKFTVNYAPEFRLRHHFFGYSLSKLKELLTKHNYVLLEIEFNNVFIAPAELDGADPVGVEQAYREGYLERSGRHEKFKANHDVEILENMNPSECVEFIDRFFAEYDGEYQIGLE